MNIYDHSIYLKFIGRDRIRTVCNVLGDAYGAGIVDRLIAKELKENETHQNAVNNFVNREVMETS